MQYYRNSRVSALELSTDTVREHKLRVQEYRQELNAAAVSRPAVKPRPVFSASQSHRRSLSQSDQGQEMGQEVGLDQNGYGLVVDLGFVEDPKIARIISWAMAKFMVSDIIHSITV